MADAPDAPLPFTPVVIIGAGRSGTNALRDMLCALPSFATWPCDEINPIWRHGNLFWPDDAIPAERATSGVRRFIRRAFVRQWRRAGCPPFLVEKTCANSLRVPFVARVLPEARFIHLTREGAAVVRSAQKRWRGEMEIKTVPYLLAKARFTPVLDLLLYAGRFLSTRLGRLTSSDEAYSSWGPRFRELGEFRRLGIAEACAAQWARCLIDASAALQRLPPGKVLHLRYDEMTTDAKGALAEIGRFLGLELGGAKIDSAAGVIRPPRSAAVDMPGLAPAAAAIFEEASCVREALFASAPRPSS